MTILEEIMLHKKNEVAAAEMKFSIAELKKSEHYFRKIFSLKDTLSQRDSSGVIAEFKRRSPSKGWINEKADVSIVTKGYAEAGAAGLSVLTDEKYFGASNDDFSLARKNQIPLLRKDFIALPYQVYETKAMGADVILLIAACLSPAEVIELSGLAKEIGLEVLLELHEETEVGHICNSIDLVGINNRDLKTFVVDIKRAQRLAASLPGDYLKIAESGITTGKDVLEFRTSGYSGFLMGEIFMKEDDPAAACASLIESIK